MAVRPQDAIKIWLKDKYNIGFVLLIVTAFLLRLYFSSKLIINRFGGMKPNICQRQNTGRLACRIILIRNDPPLFQLLAVPLLKIGLAEGALKFLLVLVPSTFVIVCIYLLGKELFTKKIALIAAFFFFHMVSIVLERKISARLSIIELPTVISSIFLEAL